MVDVELDVFSGRPNPVWTLSDAEGAHFRDRLAALPAASPSEFETNLGYRGFVVHMTNDKESPVVVRVQRGNVHVSGPGKDQYYADPGRALERWLLRTGQRFLEPPIFGVVEDELPGER